MVFIALAAQLVAQAPVGSLTLSGKVVDEEKRGIESVIRLYRNREVVSEVVTSKIGKFQLKLALSDSVTFVVMSEGYISKSVVVSSHLPAKAPRNEYIFPFFIDLYPVGKTPTHVDLDRPVGKIMYSGDQFIYDIEFTTAANAELKEFTRERKDLKVKRTE